ncbi:MAG: dephospho-CoA kinase [Gammaproteobacteria bacterium]|nr:dephospho-CoA kinase [Gammaproteobacteria bacterium]
MTRSLVVGVTGGIGSGKSTICAEFARFGAPVIDADVAAREVVEPGTPGLAEIVAEFGASVLDSHGLLDRPALRRVVFKDAARRRRLEEILHPKIRARIAEQIAALDAPYCLLAIPLLVEKGNYTFIDRILVVDCPLEIQVERVMRRDKLTVPEVEAIMRTQTTREQRLAMADDVVLNAGDLDPVRGQVAELHQRYLLLAKARQNDRINP